MANTHPDAVLREIRSLFGPGTAVGLTDAQLLERLAERRAAATEAAHEAEAVFSALVARHGPMVLGVCRRVLSDPDDIEDAFQATFLVLVRRADSVRVGDSLGPWLHGVARRVAARALAKAERRRVRSAGSGEPAAPDFDPGRAELLAALDDELGRLPGKYRTPVVLCHLEGLTHAEAARRLRWPIGTVSGRLSRARALLRERLVRRGFGLAMGPLAVMLAPEAVRAAVPESLMRATRRAAARMAMGARSPAGMSAAVALAEGVLEELLLNKLRIAAAVLALSGIIAVTALAPPRDAGQDTAGGQVGAAGPRSVDLPETARTARPGATDGRTIRFPPDRPMGVLFTRREDARDWPGGDWERLDEAVGEVLIPPGRQVRLELGAGGGADLAPLRRLRPDDLRSISVREADLRGDALAHLAHLTGLEEVELLGCPVGDEGARHLAKLTRLKALALGGCRVGDAGLASLEALRSLERLDLSDCWITEAGLAHVGRLKSLRWLSLYRSDIDDGGLSHLADLTAMESLRLAGCLHITDAGLGHLAGLGGLKSLDLEAVPITDAGLARLARLEGLEDLNLPGTKTTDAGLAHLRRLRSLRRLSLPEGMSDVGLEHVGAIRSLRELIARPGRFTDRGIAALSELDRLRELNLGSGVAGSHVTDVAAGHLARLPALRALWLQHTEVGDGGLEALAEARSLERLVLNGNRVTWEGLCHLARFPALTRLYLDGIRGTGGSTLRHLKPLGGLTHLSIRRGGSLGVDGVGDGLGDEGLGFLSGMTRLQSLTLDLPLTDAGMRHLAGLTALGRLEIRNADNRLTDDGLKCVSKLTGLTQLRVSGRITDRGLRHLEGLRSLYHVSVEGQPGAIGDEAVATLKARNPSLQVVRYSRKGSGPLSPPAVGRVAPGLAVETFDGERVELAGLRGKVVLLYFWATWCSPCLADTPRLKAFIGARRGEGRSFEAISLSLDEDAHWAVRHARRNGLDWPQAWVGVDSSACRAYAVRTAPHYAVIGPDGTVLYTGDRLESAKEVITAALRAQP